MCRRRNSLAVIAAAIAACLTVSLAAQHAGNDWVGAYLERHGLSQLLAVHLEELLEETTDTNEREALQVRLVGLYAQLVDETDDPTLRAVLEERSVTSNCCGWLCRYFPTISLSARRKRPSERATTPFQWPFPPPSTCLSPTA